MLSLDAKLNYIKTTSIHIIHYFINYIVCCKSILRHNYLWNINKVLFFLLPYTCNNLFAQNINLGTPPIQNYTKEDFRAGPQTWDIQDALGHQFFACNAGLLSYNGARWDAYYTPQNTIMRSIAYDDKDRIYTGSQNEIGYFSPTVDGLLAYTSLLPSLSPENQELSEIWDLEYLNNDLYFSDKDYIIKYNLEEQIKYNVGSLIDIMVKMGKEIWFNTVDKGLYRIEGSNAIPLPGTESIKGYTIMAIYPYNEAFLLFTDHHGILEYRNERISPWENNAQDYLIQSRIHSAEINKLGQIIVGTYLGGVAIIDTSGLTQTLINKKNGLQNNSINKLATINGNLWLSTNNGIDKVNLSSNKRSFFPDGDLEGATYDIERWDGKLFFCTSNGLYYIEEKDYYNPFLEYTFKIVKGSEGQTWGLDIVDDRLFCAHHKGGFEVKSDLTTETLISTEGVWQYTLLDEHHMALGCYNGVFLYEKDGEKWRLSRKIEGLDESSRIMALDNQQNLWVSHPYKKVYKIAFRDQYRQSTITEYDSSNGLSTDNRNYVYLINGTAYVTNETGIYSYHADQDTFMVNDMINDLFEPYNHVRRLIQKNDKIWFISDWGTGYINITTENLKTKLTKHQLPHLVTDDYYIGGFENLYPHSDNAVLVCSDNGVLNYNYNTESPSSVHPKFSKIALPTIGDSIVYGGYGEDHRVELESDDNAIRIEFTSINNNPNDILYSYKLEGLETYWTDWTEVNVKEYNNLPHGQYTFLLKAKEKNNPESETIAFGFEVAAPWQNSTLAYFIYACLTLGLILALLFIPRKKYKKNTAILETQKRETEEEMEKVKKETQVEMDRIKRETEAKMEKIEREKLEAEILFKNKELAMSTMNLLQKNETLTAIRTEVTKVEKKVKDKEARKELRKIVSLLRNDDNLEEDWENFSLNFDQVHHDFLKRIKTAYPIVTPKDQKLCAYLRMNLSTKEIAPLLKISVRGVEISRYRLRKKLELPKECNLNEFMMAF